LWRGRGKDLGVVGSGKRAYKSTCSPSVLERVFILGSGEPEPYKKDRAAAAVLRIGILRIEVSLAIEPSFKNEFIEVILELSAEAHMRKRMVDRGSQEFHNLTGAITAYGTILAVFTTLQRVQSKTCMTARSRPVRSGLAEKKNRSIAGPKVRRSD